VVGRERRLEEIFELALEVARSVSASGG